MTGGDRPRAGATQMDYPADLPEGTEIDLVAADEASTFRDSELSRINAAIDASTASIDAGHGVDGVELVKELRSTT